jgi:hypothetical protein
LTEAANRIKADNKSIRSIFFWVRRGLLQGQSEIQGVEEAAAKQVGIKDKRKKSKRARRAASNQNICGGKHTIYIIFKIKNTFSIYTHTESTYKYEML